MNPPPLVSIGLPVYNGARFLGRVLDSLRAQTLEDFELIVSDNASTDETSEICLDHAARDPRIRYIRQTRNIGAPRNWNHVARQARGRYFKWATANDECAPTLLADCVGALERDPGAVLAQGTTCLVDEDSGLQMPYADDLALMEASPVARLSSLYTRLRLYNGLCGVIRTDALRRTGLADRPYDGSDFVLLSELALQGRFLLLPGLLFFRRMGATTFQRGLEGEAKRQFFNPTAGPPLIDSRLRLHWDLLCCVLAARLGAADRLGALRLVARGIYWERHWLFSSPRLRKAQQ